MFIGLLSKVLFIDFLCYRLTKIDFIKFKLADLGDNA